MYNLVALSVQMITIKIIHVIENYSLFELLSRARRKTSENRETESAQEQQHCEPWSEKVSGTLPLSS